MFLLETDKIQPFASANNALVESICDFKNLYGDLLGIEFQIKIPEEEYPQYVESLCEDFFSNPRNCCKIVEHPHNNELIDVLLDKAITGIKPFFTGGIAGKKHSDAGFKDSLVVEDGATRPVYYESRVIHLKLDQNTLALIDSTYDVLEQQADSVTIEKSKKMLGQMESVLGADSTIESLCTDIIDHYEKNRANLLTGKAMIVAYSRPIAMKIYRKILEMRPNWNEKVGVVMTSGNNDPEDWKEIIGTKKHKEDIFSPP